jgi:hypothetical protein
MNYEDVIRDLKKKRPGLITGLNLLTALTEVFFTSANGCIKLKERRPIQGICRSLFPLRGMVKMVGVHPGKGRDCRIGVKDAIFERDAHRFHCKCKG